MIKQRIYELANDYKSKYKTEYKKLKRQRKSPLKFYLIITLLVVALLAVGNANANNLDKIEQTTTKLQQEQDNVLELREQNKTHEQQLKDLQQQLEQQQEDIKKLQARKAEQARLASIQSARPKPVQRVRPAVGCEDYRGLVSQYNWNVDTALGVMNHESGCNPLKHNWGDKHSTCMGSFGLFNVGCIHGLSVASLESPEGNVAAAYRVYLAQGWLGGWKTTCTSKMTCI